jgi:hypothetical protein
MLERSRSGRGGHVFALSAGPCDLDRPTGCRPFAHGTSDARDADIAMFYAQYGFVAFPDQPLRLFLPMKTIGTLTES